MRVAAAKSVAHRKDVTRVVAATGLAGSMLDYPSEPLAESEWHGFLNEVRSERITGLLWRAITEGCMPVTEWQADAAEWLQVRSLAASLVLEKLLIDTVRMLEEQSVPVRVLKGTSFGHLDYPDPSMRTFGDIDILVPSDRFDAAVAAFAHLGYRRTYPQPRPGFDRRYSKGASFRTADGLEIDLHRTFTMGPFGIRLDLERLWERNDSFDLAGTTIRALGREERFLHACYHAVLGETTPRLSPLRDVAQIGLAPDLDVFRLHALIRASRGEAVVARAVQASWTEFNIADMTAMSAWANTYRVDPRSAADLAAYGAGSSYTSKSLAALRSLPTMGDRAAFLYALLVPTRSYVDNRHNGRLARLRQGMRDNSRLRGAS